MSGRTSRHVEERSAAAAKAAQRLSSAPRPVPIGLRAWAMGRAVLAAANEEWVVMGVVVGSVATLAPELARFLIEFEPIDAMYVLGLLGLASLLFRELPRGIRSGLSDVQVLAKGTPVLANGEPLRRLKKRRRESGRTPELELALAQRRIGLEELARVARIDERGRYRPQARAIVPPLLALGLLGWAAGIFAVATVRILTAVLGLF